MNTEWYYVEGDETVGPTTLEDIARRIKHAGHSRLVWKEGMAEWADARAVPELSQLFRLAKPQPSAATSEAAYPAKPSAPKKAPLSQRLKHELTEYLTISAYLYICFGSLIFYKATILHSDGIEFASFGIAIVKALVSAKFILLLHALRIGERIGGIGVLLSDILKNSVLFAVFLIALTIVEEMIVGYLHGRASQEVLSEMAGGTLPQAFAVSILMLLTLIPYFAFRGVADHLGEGVLWKLLTERSNPGRAGTTAG
jgi:GYF domain 2